MVKPDKNSSIPTNHTAIGERSGAFYALSIGFLLLVTFLIYLPGVDGPFLLDDTVNLQQLGDQDGISDLQAAMTFVLGNQSGPAGRPVSMASFLLNGQDWPVAASGFKLTNLVIHLLCGALIGWLCQLLFQALKLGQATSRNLAVIVAALWLLHPLNVSTTLYVVQRMTQLMALFSLAALICYLKGRQLSHSNPARSLVLMCVSLFPLGTLAVLSKENGALLLLAILSLELTLFAGSVRTRLHRFWLLAGILIPLAGILVFFLVGFDRFTAAYQYREFNLLERLLTECRIIFDYLFSIFIPYTPDFTLHHDDYEVSRGLLNPASTLAALVLVVGLSILAVVSRRRQPALSLAIFWFLGWHLLESTFLPLELYFEHRNYLPMIGPLFAAVYYGHSLVRSFGGVVADRLVKLGVPALILGLALLTLQLTLLWGNGIGLASHWAERHPASFRAKIEYGYLLADFDEPERGYELIVDIQQRYPHEVAIKLLRWNFACSNDLPRPYPIEEIAASEQAVYYQADLTSEVRTFLENLISNQCDFPPRSDIEALMNRLAAVPMRNFERSGFHLLFSDLYVHYRELNPALIQLRSAFEIRPDPDFLIRQANISASAGYYEDSLVFLQRAREADENRGLFEATHTEEIEAMEQELRSRIDSAQGR